MRSTLSFDDRTIACVHVEPPGPRRIGTVLLLHAFPLDSGMWQPQWSHVPAGWRLVAPDLRGFGASSLGPADSGPTIDDHARDAVAVLDHVGAERAVVVGLSMGGYAALAMLRVAPHRVAGLVLADTRADADSETASSGRDAALTRLAEGGREALLTPLLPLLLGDTTTRERPDVVEFVWSLARRQPPDGLGAAIRCLRQRPDATASLETIAVPTLVLVGDEDRVTGPEIARAMHARIPGASLAVIAGAGHLTSLERPEAFNGALQRFLATFEERPWTCS